jgi:hypothetical protein
MRENGCAQRSVRRGHLNVTTMEGQPKTDEPEGGVEIKLLYLLVLVFVGGGAWTWWQLLLAVLN